MSHTPTAIEETILDHLRNAYRELEAARSLADNHCKQSAHIMQVFSSPQIDHVIQEVDDITWELYARVEGVAKQAGRPEEASTRKKTQAA